MAPRSDRSMTAERETTHAWPQLSLVVEANEPGAAARVVLAADGRDRPICLTVDEAPCGLLIRVSADAELLHVAEAFRLAMHLTTQRARRHGVDARKSRRSGCLSC